MLLIDDLLLLPISGFKFIFRTLQKMAEEQYTDDAPIKERLLELQLELESGELSEEEYVKEEAAIIRQFRDIEKHKRELAGLPAEEAPGGLSFRPGERSIWAALRLPCIRIRNERNRPKLIPLTICLLRSFSTSGITRSGRLSSKVRSSNAF